MAEPSDGIERPVDYSAIYANRRSHGILLNVPDSRISVFESPVQRLPSPEAGSIGRGSLGIVRGNFRRRGIGRGQSFDIEYIVMIFDRRWRAYHHPARVEWPSWYKRRALDDITNINWARAVERRRGAGMGEGDGREIEIPAQQQVGVLDSPTPLGGDIKCSMVTPGPRTKRAEQDTRLRTLMSMR